MNDEIAELPLSVLLAACQEHTEYFKQNQPSDSRYCTELFRRAIVVQDEDAWDALYTFYTPVIKNWLFRSAATLVESALRHRREAIDESIQDAFIQFFAQFYHQKLQFEAFDLPGLIRYLEKCARTALRDKLREPPLYPLEEVVPAEHVTEHDVLRSMQAEALLEALRQRVAHQEWRLLELRYAENMKSSEAAAAVALSVEQVYRLLPKLRRFLSNDPRLRSLYDRWVNEEEG
jgi:RNA polymerase sigma factor (sigma-70 family)